MSVDKSSMPPTPIKDKTDPPILPFGYKSRVSPFNSVSRYRSFGGSKDETFFDTQAWLDSDCDDDFYSVNGDFTPSRGSTPIHHAAGTPRLSRVFSPQVSRAVFEGKPPIRSASNRSQGNTSVRQSFSSTTQATGVLSEDVAGSNTVSSSTTKSKKLIDLFRESMRERGGVGLASPLPPRSANRTPSGLRYSVSSTDVAVPVNDHVPVEEKPAKFTHRCFPRFAYVRSFSESKKTSNPPTYMDDLKS